jgi:hypothetical protein
MKVNKSQSYACRNGYLSHTFRIKIIILHSNASCQIFISELRTFLLILDGDRSLKLFQTVVEVF